jgi:amino acid transporter
VSVQEPPSADPKRMPKIERGEVISTVSAIVLLAAMFATDWYGLAGVPEASATRPAISTAKDAWHTLTVLRWLMLATIAVSIGAAILHFTQRGHGSRTDTGLIITVLGTVTAVLVFYRVLISLPMPAEVIDQKLGALVGLVGAIGIAVGGFESLRAERAQERRLVQRSKPEESLSATPNPR